MFASNNAIQFPVISTPAQPAQYLVLDIETGNAPKEFIELALNNWEPPKNIKDAEKIEARRVEAFDKIMERGALLDASPIICIAVKTDKWQIVFTSMQCKEKIEGWEVLSLADESEMLKAFRLFLDKETSPETIIVGHNVKGFDLPKIRNAYIRHRLKLPELLAIKQVSELQTQVVDTAQLFKAFSMEHRNDFCPSITDMAVSLGLPQPKEVISGADVPKMHEQGKYHEILTYCCIDVATTTAGYLLMAGQWGELK